MTEDLELDNWREQWSRVAGPSPAFQRETLQKIKRQNQRFVLGNVLTAIVFGGLLILAAVLRHQETWLGSGWAAGICVLVAVSVGIRIWTLQGTWRAETQSTRAFVELWYRRVEARLRLLRISIWVSVGWIVFCAALTAINWPTIGRDIKARPTDWLEVLVACIVMQPVIWFFAAKLRRRKLAELSEVKKILDGMNEGK
jgi:hypothetical protein